MINIVFFGTPEYAASFLEILHNEPEINIQTVICQPDKPVGRKKQLEAPATKKFAEKHGIQVLQPKSLKKSNIYKQLSSIDADLFIVVAYGKIIPKNILDLPKFGTINVHPSLLPKYRGPSPIQSAIAAGENNSGVSIMLLDEEMDHGPILAQEKLKIQKIDTSFSFRDKTIDIGGPLLIKTIHEFTKGELNPKPQNHQEATYCQLLSKSDAKIDWHQTAEEIDQKFRAYQPWPGIFTSWEKDGNETILKIHDLSISKIKINPGEIHFTNDSLLIGTSSNAIKIKELQPANKKKMITSDFLKGYQNSLPKKIN